MKTREDVWKLPGPSAGPEYRQGFAAAREQAEANGRAIWNDAIEAAARLIETGQETSGADGSSISPRYPDNVAGLTFAKAIRELKRSEEIASGGTQQ